MCCASALIKHVTRHVSGFIDRRPQWLVEQLTTRFSAEVSEYLLAVMQRRDLPKGTSLLRPGELCSYQAFVCAGCLRAFFYEDDGTQRVLYFAAAGTWVTDIESFLSGQASTMAIDAIVRSELLVFHKSALEEIRSRVPAFETVIREWRETAMGAMQKRLRTSLRKTAVQRYADFIADYPALVDRIPQYHIAAYLGITPEFLSTLRRRVAENR